MKKRILTLNQANPARRLQADRYRALIKPTGSFEDLLYLRKNQHE